MSQDFPDFKINKGLIFSIVLLIIVVIVLFKSAVTIGAGEAGVVFKPFAGGVDRETTLGEGFHIIMPWNKVVTYEVRQQEEKEKMKEELEEAKAAVEQLRSDLNEVNLLNSKLLYTNKIFRNKNLTENQKIKVLKAFDKAETVKQAKTIFETLNENLVAKTKKSNIRESLGAASKPAGVAPKRNLNEGIVQEDAMVSRFKKLAGIN